MQSNLGVSVGDITIPAIFFADDIVLIGKDEEDLKKLLNMVGEEGMKLDMSFNYQKSSGPLLMAQRH
jgi:hypothetical protein